MIVGVISDTHGLLRPEALARLAGVAHILHAGDIGAPEILDALAEIAPVTAVRGNVDTEDWARALPERAALSLNGRELLMVHDRADLSATSAADVMVFGHSHRPSVEIEDDALWLNPGSAGPRRFNLPITVALLDLGSGAPTAKIIPLT